MRRATAMFVVACAVCVFVSVVCGIGALVKARAGQQALSRAQVSVRRLDGATAGVEFARARRDLAAARNFVDFPLARPMRIVPIVGRHLRVARALAAAGELGARAGLAANGALEAAPPGGWALRRGEIDLSLVRRARSAAREALPQARRALRELQRAPQGWVAGPLAVARAQALGFLAPAVGALQTASAGLEAMPTLLGEDGPKRYVIAFANPAELRGTGGFFGYFTIIEADKGKIRFLEDQGRPVNELPAPASDDPAIPAWFKDAYADYGALATWSNVNISTDFPVVGQIIAQVPSKDGRRVDGVIQVTPRGLRGLLANVGPVEVGRRRTRVTADTVEPMMTHLIYRSTLDRDAREEFLRDVVDATIRKTLDGELKATETSLKELGAIVAGGHIQAYSRHAGDQRALERLALARGAARAPSATDVLGIASSNAAGNKIDWFLRRRYHYQVRLDPDSGTARARFRMTLDNAAPSTGMPEVVIGSTGSFLPAGTNLQIMLMLRRPNVRLESLTINGRPAGTLVEAREDELRSFQFAAEIRSRSQTVIEAEFFIPAALRPSGEALVYHLHLLPQPTIFGDRVDVVVEAPGRWRVLGRPSFTSVLSQDADVAVTLLREPDSMADIVVKRPWRLLKGFLRAVV